jgi:hypothetical protein
MAETAEDRYKERLKRVEDAISLKVPDRVPFLPNTHLLAARFAGLSAQDAFYQTDRWVAANKQMVLELEPDMYFAAAAVYPGTALDILDCRQIRWPGHGVSGFSTFQFVEGEYMKADEYDAFLADPSDYIIRVYMPRLYGALEPLRNLPSIDALFLQGYKGAIFGSAVFADPSIAEAFASLYRAGLEASKYLAILGGFDREMAALGFPQAFGVTTYAPFDLISDMLRGMRGTMLDMYRQPDKLHKTMEKVFPMLLKSAVDGAKRGGNPRVFIPLHRGSDGFMSLKQFETFYWPGLKKLILGLVDAGMTPCAFLEGDCTTRLPYLRELPRGKVLAMFDTTDIFKAKEIVGDTICIVGGMPVSLLSTGTPEQIKEQTRRLIEGVGRGGGFIMSARTVLDDAKPELVKVWAECTREYGGYR